MAGMLSRSHFNRIKVKVITEIITELVILIANNLLGQLLRR